MIEPTITCPNCSTDIKVTESLAAPIIQAMRHEYQEKIAAKEAEVSSREIALKAQQKTLTEAQNSIDEQVEQKLKIERQVITEQETKKAKLASEGELTEKIKEVAELQIVLQQRGEKLAEAQKAQAEFLKNQRALEDEKREMELTIEKRILDSLAEVREKAKREAEDSLKLKVSEKEEKIASMQRQIEDLMRKAEQGSQQLQGEVMELELEQMLRTKFPFDIIEPVAKGEFGGDVIQRVVSPTGLPCGSILWELKRTKNWSDSWLTKLRSDQRAAKAEISVLISQTLPKDMKSFENIDGVWVAAPQYTMPLVMALRHLLIEVACSKQSQQGQQTKMELVYDYLTGQRFRHRVEAIVEKFSDMQADLNREKKSMTRLWAKREGQIQAVIESTVGMYGDLQGIAGRALKEIDGLEVPLLGNDDVDIAQEDE